MAGVVLWPQGLACPNTSNWGDWKLGRATEQTACLSPVAGGSRLYIRAVYVSLCLCVCREYMLHHDSGWS